MFDRSRILLVLGGLVAGVVGTLTLSGGFGSPVQAQPPAKAAEHGRYQISAWGYSSPQAGGTVTEHGAYIIDTMSGDVFSVNRDSDPKPVGTVAKKK